MDEKVSTGKDARAQSNIFKDVMKLDEKWIPRTLPQRRRELLFLIDLFKVVIERPASFSRKVLLVGGPGSGKTVLARGLGEQLERTARRDYGLNLKYIHIFCDEQFSYKACLDLISQGLNIPSFSHNQTIRSLVGQIKQALGEENYLIVGLDNVDRIQDPSFLNMLFSTTEDSITGTLRVSYILIAQDEQFREQLRFQIPKVTLPQYSYEDLIEIITSRVELAFRKGVGKKTVWLIARLCRESGNVRDALTLLQRGGESAEGDGLNEIPSECIIREGGLSRIVEYCKNLRFDRDQKIILVAFLRAFRHAQGNVTRRIVWKEYLRICLGCGELPKHYGHVLMNIWVIEEVARLTYPVSETARPSDDVSEFSEQVDLLIPIEDFEELILYKSQNEEGWDFLNRSDDVLHLPINCSKLP